MSTDERLAAKVAADTLEARQSDIVTLAQQMFMLQIGHHGGLWLVDGKHTEAQHEVYLNMAHEALSAARAFVEVSRAKPQAIRWRGSVTDLATDCAYVLTPEQGHELVAELTRFLTVTGERDKFQGKKGGG